MRKEKKKALKKKHEGKTHEQQVQGNLIFE